jgi:hypothetical protein
LVLVGNAGRARSRSSWKFADESRVGHESRLPLLWRGLVIALVCAASPAFAQSSFGPSFDPHAKTPNVNDRLDDQSQLRIEVSETFLNRLVARHDVRQSNVRDFVLGADVHGRETTVTDVAIELRPSSGSAAADMVLVGRNYPDTLGYTPQAVVHTRGFHSFTARKLVVYDGELFHTQRPRVSVAACNETVGLWTPFSGIPLLGPAVNSFAFQMALQRCAEGEAVAAQKIGERVGPEFNKSLDDQLAQLNHGWLTTLSPKLRQMRWRPDRVRAATTDNALRIAVHYEDMPDPAAHPHPADLAPNHILLHESLLNRAFDRLMRAGTMFQPAEADEYWFQINGILQAWTAEPEPPDSATGPSPTEGVTVRLGERDPIRVEFLTDQAVLHATAAISVPPLAESPLLHIAIRFRIERDESAITFAPDRVRIEPAEPDQPGLGAIAPLIEQQALANVRALRIPRRVKLPPPDLAHVEITIRDITAGDGWLLLSFE